MGQAFSSQKARATGVGTAPGEPPRIERNESSERRTTIEVPIHVTIPPQANGEFEYRPRGTELLSSGSPRPDSTNARLNPSLLENDDGTAVASDGQGLGSPRRFCSEHRRFSRSSFAVSDTETVTHPDTRLPVFRRGSVANRPALTIVDESLIGILSETDAVSVDSPIYEGMLLSTITHIHVPYEALFYCRKKILEATKTGDSHTPKHAQFLLDFMEKEYPETWIKSRELDERVCQKIAFEHAWLLYSPGETVFRNSPGGRRAYRVARVEPGTRSGLDPIRIFGYYLALDQTGRSLVPHLEVLRVGRYHYERPVGGLEVVPEWYVEKYMNQIFTDLMARGKSYWGYRGKLLYKEHRGDGWPMASDNNRCNVILDHATSSRHDAEANLESSIPPSCFICAAESSRVGPWFEAQEHMHDDPCECKGSKSVDVCLDNNFIYCPSMIWAFSLEHTSWRMVSIDSLHDLRADEGNWNRLLMSEESKTQLDMMVSAYFREWEARQHLSNGYNEITATYSGRRRGYSLRFHGGTGTGKTFTAECLAEKHGRPLYRVACGSFGIKPSIFEHQLRTILLRAANWGTIVLFENADMFVQECDPHNLQRNALNSILIHHLDLSGAFVIFTTNRSSGVDERFQSRVAPEQYFEPLDFVYQKLIWKHLLEKMNLTGDSFSLCERFIDSQLKDFEDGYHQKMNGWQIERCLHAALAIANVERRGVREKLNLRDDHIKKVLRLGKEFKEHMRGENPSYWMLPAPDADP
ncbi:hypothetical protein V8F20_005704 [Naviculisporaceae sp. PSN 640]